MNSSQASWFNDEERAGMADFIRVYEEHYEQTANAWLANLDANRERALPILQSAYGAEQAPVWLQRWRMFFMACAELWGYREGREWFGSHYLFERQSDT